MLRYEYECGGDVAGGQPHEAAEQLLRAERDPLVWGLVAGAPRLRRRLLPPLQDDVCRAGLERSVTL